MKNKKEKGIEKIKKITKGVKKNIGSSDIKFDKKVKMKLGNVKNNLELIYTVIIIRFQ